MGQEIRQKEKKTLAELAAVIRSKNAGPFEITFDILFDNACYYRRVKESGVLTREHICQLYSARAEDVVCLEYFDQALGIKVTLRRHHPSGSAGERDTYGAQQHVPLLTIEIPDFFEQGT
ncbi:hypothetical protein J2S00_001634 [Caldalkalibacillus uzonensis]|uniref:DUF4387 domain-containing protein n=1 Tax=Caldalkalibacillus uzonensis TaxID=353224 RepID=A0ABU0CQZ6_9BACI|nr:DUF4387 domain-containing protein [Caldalkalibacillus uzonensis]MDQ0338848.1 hypothetical protein [Caldalkalibacillus uzonensis]